MKKLLILILIGLLVALSVFIVISGFEVGKTEILSYVGIKEKNEYLDEKIQESSKLAEKDYKQAVSTVQESSKKLEQTKKQYQEMITISEDGDIKTAGQIERYEIETLWVKLGNYATSEGAVVKIDIVQGNTKDSYNLRFTVNGSYISITDYISDIENDSTLGFKIEEFKMLPSGNDLQATFTCKEIAIKEISSTTTNASSNTQQQTMNNGTNNTNSTNTTGGTNTNSTGNMTNANNTNATNSVQ